ncbi:hypothetical protein NCH01_27150 [Neoasaia chiangmaiensis]|uniref:Uncharacterized protein n=1 Tax=Neoasaia chiangmaiensis TaxID=320497 RepID=A0A1U9KP75_9PROT|nr:hypothetical protein [Neoasaia chiangmaiensis]AQS87490.1 hypothetical protein A0U93_05555 [Neoasaia chiangmaiensis]GEN16284.1 hypothetical protein NCH01_27150 [Neoasaia chiangmaiensis]
MSKPEQAPGQNRVVDLKVAAHLMTLDAGLFCIFHAPGQSRATAGGLPGVRVSHAPNMPVGLVSISTFDDDGWLGASDGAALVKVARGPAQVLVTIYQAPNSTSEAPRLQVVQLGGVRPAQPAPVAVAPLPQPHANPATAPQAMHVAGGGATEAPAGGKPEIAAHVQRRGDVLSRLGEWMGAPGSQAWIEGFGVSPDGIVPESDIEYQAVLGKGWLSPWAEGGQYCGSRGMALPILGLRVRLKGKSAEKFDVQLTATFTDGSRIGPVDGRTAAEAESLAPLEAFLLEIVPHGAAKVEKPSSGPVVESAGKVADKPAKPRKKAAVASAPAEAPATVKKEPAKSAAKPKTAEATVVPKKAVKATGAAAGKSPAKADRSRR